VQSGSAGWLGVGDQGQITGGQLLGDELNTIQQAGAGWVRVNFRLGQCFANWTSVGCNGLTALPTYDQVLSNVQSKNLKVLGMLSSGVSGDYYGLLHTNSNPKPAFTAYQKYATY
jgi:hypothetical protein